MDNQLSKAEQLEKCKKSFEQLRAELQAQEMSDFVWLFVFFILVALIFGLVQAIWDVRKKPKSIKDTTKTL
ncbi:hypothetical protein XELAEV_18022010mg [Xenopus laevis]|uniref:Uncharacterized protein n=1 Tax=Xenopus laevis TaxID=8355 RepID=A0A974D3Y9_XENLA|nr:hypothetical protein XELAEV_18022010mg [Xenopus laevis]